VNEFAFADVVPGKYALPAIVDALTANRIVSLLECSIAVWEEL